MCNHNPITIHEHGGTTVICAYCGRVLKPWRANGETGAALDLLIVSASIAVFWAFVVWIMFHLTEPEAVAKANIAAFVAWLVSFAMCLDTLAVCTGGKKDNHDAEAE